MLSQILARITGQDLRRALAQVLDNQEQEHERTKRTHFLLHAQGILLGQVRESLMNLETLVTEIPTETELDAATDDIRSAINDAVAKLSQPANDQSALLAEIADLTAQLTAAQSDDQATADQIADLGNQLAAKVADAQENAAKLQEGAAQLRAATNPAPAEPTDPDAPVDPTV